MIKYESSFERSQVKFGTVFLWQKPSQEIQYQMCALMIRLCRRPLSQWDLQGSRVSNYSSWIQRKYYQRAMLDLMSTSVYCISVEASKAFPIVSQLIHYETVLLTQHVPEHTHSLQLSGSDLRAQLCGLPEERVYLYNKDLRASEFRLCLHFSFPLSISTLSLSRLFSSPCPLSLLFLCIKAGITQSWLILGHLCTSLLNPPSPKVSVLMWTNSFKRRKISQQFWTLLLVDGGRDCSDTRRVFPICCNNELQYCSSCTCNWSQSALDRGGSPGNWELPGEGLLTKPRLYPLYSLSAKWIWNMDKRKQVGLVMLSNEGCLNSNRPKQEVLGFCREAMWWQPLSHCWNIPLALLQAHSISVPVVVYQCLKSRDRKREQRIAKRDELEGQWFSLGNCFPRGGLEICTNEIAWKPRNSVKNNSTGAKGGW